MSPRGIATSRSIFKKTNAAKLWLLLIGVNQYQDEQIPNLNYSAIDCQGLSLALADATDKFPNKTTYIYHDFTAESPCLNHIRTSLKQITATAQPDDTVLFYFSGHGILQSSTERAFLCLTDTYKSNLVNTGLAIDEILQSLNHCAAQNKLVWLDACHSGGMTLRGLTPKLVEALQQNAAISKGFYALLSCDTNQQSWEFPELGHGVFTYFLMRGLRGEAANAQGLITADALYTYIYYQTLQYVDKTNQQLRLINQQKQAKGETLLQREYSLQTPKRIVEGVGEIILGKTPQQDTFLGQNRIGIVIEGLSDNQHTLEIGKLLGGVGSFQLKYLQAAKVSVDKIKEAISQSLQATTTETILLYIRGRIEETATWEGLVIGENIRIKLSWLKQILRENNAKQIIILDCPNIESNHGSLQQCIEDLQLDSEKGQCLIGCNSPSCQPEKFAEILLDILTKTSLTTGLSAAGCISQLQLQLAGSDNLQVWLSGTQGIIEIIPSKSEFLTKTQNQGIDLNLCPYMGLNAFSTEDDRYFYGREILTQQLIYQTQKTAFIAIVGASGSGKSSLVQAGLIPALRQGKQIPNSDKWLIKTIRPGKNPLESIINWVSGIEENLHPCSLSSENFVYWLRTFPQPMLILIIDQFEELFTLVSIEEREKFLAILLTAVKYASDRFKLIITIRADFISSCLEIPQLTQLLQDSSLLVPPKLNQEDYRRVIVKPAEQVGLKVEPELVEILLRDLDSSVGDLPLLEFVLEQLWQHRRQGKLTLKNYQEKLGGIKGALERSSQAVYESLSPEAQECAKWIFLSLTQLGEGTEDTRRRVFKSELIVEKFPAELVEKTLAAFVAAKLIVINLEQGEEELITKYNQDGQHKNISNAPSPMPHPQSITIEVAHEILIRHWTTLRSWLEENRSRLRLQRQIEQAAQLWKQKGEQADFLLQGIRLAEAEDIYIRYTDELSADIQYFVEACLKQRKNQQLQEKIRLRQAQRGLVALSILGIAACCFGGLAYFQAREAKLREIQALNSSTQANLLSNQQLEALINSVEAGKQLQRTVAVPQEIGDKTLNNLQQVLSTISEKNRFHGHNSWVAAVSFSPDGEIIASASTDKTIKLWRQDGELFKTFIAHSDGIEAVSFSPDGKIIASASSDNTIKLWNREGNLLKTIYGHDSGVDSVNFSPDGELIISGSDDTTIKIWDKNGKLLNTLQGHIKGVNKVIYSNDGEIIASASDDNTIKLWRSDGSLLKTLQGHTDGVWNLSFSPDGQKIASISADKTIKLWSRKGDLLQTLPMGNTIKIWNKNNTLKDTFIHHNNQINSISLSPDGKTLATASDDYTVRIWNIDNILQNTFIGHQDEVSSVKFSKNGQKITSVSDDGTMKIWRKDGKLLNTLSAPINNVGSFNLSPDKEIVVFGTKNGNINIFNRDNRLLHTIKAHRGWIININFSPDGRIFASSAVDGTIKLWSRNGKLLQSLNRHSGWVTKVKFSPDGKIIASAGADNTVKLWNLNGQLLHNLTGHLSSVWDINFSPNSDMIASGSADKTIKIWKRNGRLIATLMAHSDSITSVIFSRDGQLIASSSDDDTIKLWSHDGKLLKTIKGHNGNVRSLDFSPDAKILVTASADKTLKLWNLEKIELQPLNLNTLVQKGCHWLNDYLKNNRKISEWEKEVCK